MDKINWDIYENIIAYNILTDETYVASVMEYIKPEFFSNPRVSTLCSIITSFYEKHGKVPNRNEIKSYVINTGQVEQFKQIIEQLKEYKDNYNQDELYSNTETFIREKSIFFTIKEIAKEGLSSYSPDKLLEKVEQSCSVDLSTDFGHDFFEDIDKHIEYLQSDDSRISTGWNWLDGKLGGGFLENGKALYIFLGRTNVGKSLVLGNLAVNMALNGTNVLLITLEMSEQEYARRFSAQTTGLNIATLRENVETLKSNIEDLKSRGVGSLMIKEFPPSTYTPSQIEAFIDKAIKKGKKFDIVVLDYINLINTPHRMDLYEKGDYISKKVRAMSYKHKKSYVSVTQANRSGFNSSPDLDNVSESVGLPANADFVGNLWDEEEEREEGLIHMGVIKSRFGQAFGSITMRKDPETLRITEEAVDIQQSEIDDTMNEALDDLFADN